LGGLAEHVFSLLDGTTNRPSRLVPGQNARRWMSVKTGKAMFSSADKVCVSARNSPPSSTAS